jgi:hypothetical protein
MQRVVARDLRSRIDSHVDVSPKCGPQQGSLRVDHEQLAIRFLRDGCEIELSANSNEINWRRTAGAGHDFVEALDVPVRTVDAPDLIAAGRIRT